jgi:hypothetical protein
MRSPFDFFWSQSAVTARNIVSHILPPMLNPTIGHQRFASNGPLGRCISAATVILVLFGVAVAPPIQAEEYLSGIQWPAPALVTPGQQDRLPPSDAVVLFDGSDLSQWQNGDAWRVADGVAYAGDGFIISKPKFGDCQVHLEWSAPTPPSGEGQGRGNSGLFLMGTYEIQILDSYQNTTYFDGQAGAIYKQTPPLVNAMRPPGAWNTYDIFWTRPRFQADGSLKSPAFITAVHNGVLILNHFELQGDTPFNRPPAYTKHEDKLPISIQDHGNPVRFRNIWVREITPLAGKRIHEPKLVDH